MFFERKNKRSNIWSKDLVYEKTFQLSSHTPGYSLKSCPGQGLPKLQLNKINL